MDMIGVLRTIKLFHDASFTILATFYVTRPTFHVAMMYSIRCCENVGLGTRRANTFLLYPGTIHR